MPLEGPEQFDPERVGTIEYSGRGATTAYLSPSGAFEFTGVKPGRYALYATDGVSTSWEELQVTGNMNDVVLDVPTTSTSEGILVRLTTLAAPRMFNNSFSVRDSSLPPKRIDVAAVPVNRVSWLLVPKDAG